MHRRQINVSPCKRNLLDLQRKKNLPPSQIRGLIQWNLTFESAVCRAVCAHDWDKLQTLLVESPLWEHGLDLLNYHTIDLNLRVRNYHMSSNILMSIAIYFKSLDLYSGL